MDCLFCLLDKPKTKKQNAPCDCTPYLHQKCLNKWYKINPNECPICRCNYEDVGIIYVDYSQLEIRLYENYLFMKKVILFICCFMIIYMLSMFLF
jgi:hypothetical protein